MNGCKCMDIYLKFLDPNAPSIGMQFFLGIAVFINRVE